MEQDPRESDDRGPDSGPDGGSGNGPENGSDDGPVSVPDKDLPEDLQPAEDNPLAQPAGDDVPDDVITEGAGHQDSSGAPEDASSPGKGDAAGGPASPDEASSGTRSKG